MSLSGPALWLLGAWLVPVQDGPIPPSPFDQEIVLELTADDPVMIEGRGPAQVVEYVAEFEGTLHIWTSSELDLFLRVEDISTMERLAEDDDSGGGTTPYLRLDVKAGDRLAVFVACAPEETGAFALHLVAAPETAVTREVAAAVRRALSEAKALQNEGDLDGARELVKAATLEGIAGAESSQGVADALWDVGFTAYDTGDNPVCSRAWSRARRHRERTLPNDR